MASGNEAPRLIWRKKWDSRQAESVPIIHVTDFWVKVHHEEVILSWGQTQGPYVNEESPQVDIDELGPDVWPVNCVARVGMSRQAAINLRTSFPVCWKGSSPKRINLEYE